jgi:hypothetical protein
MFVEKGEIFPEKFMESQLMRCDHSAKIWNLQKKCLTSIWTSIEGLVRLQYKCLVPIYVFPEMKLRGILISKTE